MPENSKGLSSAIDKYLKYMEFVKTSSPLTLKAYRTDLAQVFVGTLAEGTEGAPVSEAVRRDSMDETELLKRSRQAQSRWTSLSLSTRNRKAATLKSFFGWVYQERLTDRDLALQIVCPKVPKKLPHFLSVDEALAVLSSFA
ncbi:MAG: hypothetical protein EOP06_10640, partial [Proteobacteria bacterium]